MILISHRGNINGRVEFDENKPTYIDLAISKGYDVEIDIWYQNNILWLGHDKPQYVIDLEFLLERKNKLWIHTKNFKALSYLINTGLRVFYHEKEKHSIINNTINIWSHDLLEVDEKSIIPLINEEESLKSDKFKNVFGICSDYLNNLKI